VLAWALETESLALGLQVATAIENLWVTHDAGEAMRGFAALLDHPGARAVPPEVRAPPCARTAARRTSRVTPAGRCASRRRASRCSRAARRRAWSRRTSAPTGRQCSPARRAAASARANRGERPALRAVGRCLGSDLDRRTSPRRVALLPRAGVDPVAVLRVRNTVNSEPGASAHDHSTAAAARECKPPRDARDLADHRKNASVDALTSPP
jgi:hypothetical protein